MKFYKVTTSEPVIKIIADTISKKLADKQKFFWLVTGGSAIAIEASVSKIIKHHDLSRLTVVLMDERYGPIGHADSNWQQLLDAGFEVPGATLIPILRGKDRSTSTNDFAFALENAFDRCDYSLGQFGIGPDGHTAGILPNSPNMNTDELATSYADNEATQEFTEGVYRDKDRITMTARAIARLDEAVVVALNKKPSLFENLEKTIDIAQMPAQVLKQVKVLSIYNDYKGVTL